MQFALERRNGEGNNLVWFGSSDFGDKMAISSN